MDINKIFEKWAELTEVDPSAETIVITNRNADVYRFNGRISEAVEVGNQLDGVIVLKHCLNTYMKYTSFSMEAIIGNNESYTEKIKLAKELKNLLSDEEILDYENSINRDIQSLSKNYEFNLEDITSKADQFLIYINAKKAAAKMDRVAFRRGQSANATWKYTQNIMVFDSIEELLLAVAKSSFDGITLNAVIDKENAAYSYFCFIIKDGENVYMISDRPKGNYARKYEGRAPGKRMEERISTYMFPYEILGLEISKYSVKSKYTTELSTRGFVGGTIKSIDAMNALWITCCFHILKQKYQNSEFKECNDVFCGSMITIAEESENTGLIPADSSCEIALGREFKLLKEEKIRMNDVVHKEIKYDYAHERTFYNDWLIKRYKDQVDEDMLNLTENSEVDTADVRGFAVSMNIFENNTIGTQEEIKQRRLFIARRNMAKIIGQYYKLEVDEKISELESWYFSKVASRLDYLKKIVASGECILTRHEYHEFCSDKDVEAYNNGEKVSLNRTKPFTKVFDQKRKENCLRISETKHIYGYREPITILDKLNSERTQRSFFESGPVSYQYFIDVNCPEAIAEICGITVEKLPLLLQHYTPFDDIGNGNPILYDLDPVEFIPNHISRFRANIVIAVSKKEVRDLKKTINNK